MKGCHAASGRSDIGESISEEVDNIQSSMSNVRQPFTPMYHSDEVSMGTQDFGRFVASQHETPIDTKIDWAGMRDEWLRDLGALHQQIVHFLHEFTKAGSISYRFTEIQLTEENLGKYWAKRMDIKIGRQRVSLVPVGTLLIGCRGRVDAVGSAGRAQILLVDERAKSARDLIRVTVSVKGSAPPSVPRRKEPLSWAWKIVNNTPQKKFVDLDRESFLALLMEIANA